MITLEYCVKYVFVAPLIKSKSKKALTSSCAKENHIIQKISL